MSTKRPPARRVSTRKAPPTPAEVKHSTGDRDSQRESDITVEQEPEKNRTQSTQKEPNTKTQPTKKEPKTATQPTKKEPKTATQPTQKEPATKSKTESTVDDYDSLTEGAPETTTATAEPEIQHPTANQETTAAVSIVTSSSTTIPDSGTTEKTKSRRKTKQDIFKEYMFGRDEDDLPDRDTAASLRQASLQRTSDQRFRRNRTYDMRKNCNARRLDLSRMVSIEETESVTEDLPKRNLGYVPPMLFRQPKIVVRPTLGSKFRYLYNRRPQGVKIYFKHTKADPKDRPPFVTCVGNHCRC